MKYFNDDIIFCKESAKPVRHRVHQGHVVCSDGAVARDMGCCLGKPAEENKDPLIYDVQRIIENEVWQSYCDVHPWSVVCC